MIPADEDAPIRRCAMVAIHKAAWIANASVDPAFAALDEASMELFGERSVVVNDTKGHDAVMAVYAVAILMATAEAEGVRDE